MPALRPAFDTRPIAAANARQGLSMKTIWLILAAFLTLLHLASCGDGGGGASTTSSPGSSSSSGSSSGASSGSSGSSGTSAAALAVKIGKPARLLVGLGGAANVSSIRSQGIQPDISTSIWSVPTAPAPHGHCGTCRLATTSISSLPKPIRSARCRCSRSTRWQPTATAISPVY